MGKWAFILTDVMALILTFLVMLFSISSLHEQPVSLFHNIFKQERTGSFLSSPRSVHSHDQGFQSHYVQTLLQKHFMKIISLRDISVQSYHHSSDVIAEFTIPIHIQKELITRQLSRQSIRTLSEIRTVINNIPNQKAITFKVNEAFIENDTDKQSFTDTKVTLNNVFHTLGKIGFDKNTVLNIDFVDPKSNIAYKNKIPNDKIYGGNIMNLAITIYNKT